MPSKMRFINFALHFMHLNFLRIYFIPFFFDQITPISRLIIDFFIFIAGQWIIIHRTSTATIEIQLKWCHSDSSNKIQSVSASKSPHSFCQYLPEVVRFNFLVIFNKFLHLSHRFISMIILLFSEPYFNFILMTIYLQWYF